MTNIAILGFGVVGSGVADLISSNYKNVVSLGKDEINIKYILDLRDFPDSVFSDRVVHDFETIVNDEDVSVVIEVMGGSHPAYEYTRAALEAGKSVISSNKEVVANFGDEFLSIAKRKGVSYRFEAAVGGGIPVIAPLISCVLQNKVSEVRGILNGTTNYILTQMFSFGESFESALKNAQAKGYAERNPDADILGIDACRKIAILAAIATGRLISTEKIHTEGITGIRSEDVIAAEKIGCNIKLVGRCIIGESAAPYIFVAPFLVPCDSALSSVSGVYNAVEVVAEPLGNVMFYGRGAGAGPTASAVVGDLMIIMNGGDVSGLSFEKSCDVSDIADFKSQQYIALDKKYESAAREQFENIRVIKSDSEFAFLTSPITDKEAENVLSQISAKPLSRIRLL